MIDNIKNDMLTSSKEEEIGPAESPRLTDSTKLAATSIKVKNN